MPQSSQFLQTFAAVQSADERSRRVSRSAILFVAFVLLTGCRGAAYRDVYTQKMAGEIRNLEDQLYQADYENQVLNDRLSRAELRSSQVQIPSGARRPTFMGKTLDENGNVINVAPEPREAPQGTANPSNSGSVEIETPLQPAPQTSTPKLPARPILPPTDAPENLVPPAEAVPPGKNDVMLPDVELGEPMPPRSADPADVQPEFHPGQIQLPDSAKRLGEGSLSEPVAIRINPSLSGASHSETGSTNDGVTIFIEAIDEAGKVVPLDRFDIDANLSIALLDPELPAAQARLGKWEFGPEQIREMIRSETDSQIYRHGIHVMVPWGDRIPKSSTVTAHVRLAAAEAKMQTSADLNVSTAQVAEWMPRANDASPRNR